MHSSVFPFKTAFKLTMILTNSEALGNQEKANSVESLWFGLQANKSLFEMKAKWTVP